MNNDMDKMFDMDEEILDEIILGIGEEIEEDELRASMLNTTRLNQMKLSYEALCHMMGAQNVKVSYKLNEPFKSMGSISVEGELVAVKNPILFAHIAAVASNTEVYPLEKNAVRLTFTFHELTTPIE